MRQIFTKLSLILVVLLMATGGALAQFTVSGQVTDSENEPLIGVTITVKGKTLGTITDFNGRYSLEVPGTTATLLFSYIGYATVEQEVSSNDPSVSITLSDEATLLDEVVVTGLASSVKRSNLANAVATVNSQELTGITTQQTVDGALYGKMTGVNVVSSGGAPGGGIAIRLRGVSSLSGNNQPLFIVDGVYISNAEIPSGLRFASGANSGTEEGASNRIADLNPDDIESI
ncbi:MAG: carboxypeptidase-like regulatory domain-containing protein, partial [Bacteroidota bacterium]